MPAYRDALIRQIKETAPRLRDYYIDTVYFGGGTPSYCGAKYLVSVFDALKRNFKVMKSAEVTLEANPESVNGDELFSLRKAGFNRVSLGVQTFNDVTLQRIERAHSSERALDAMEAIREAGFDNFSLDLIYGLPGQTRDEWADTLNRAVKSAPKHISAYGLKIERGTPLWAHRKDDDIPDDDTQADMYLYTVDTLAAAGFAQYEISNFAVSGFESKHNLKYWRLDEYCGFGANAASFIAGTRFKCVNDPKQYIVAVLDGGEIFNPEETEALTLYESASEYIMLGMRTVRGICRDDYEQRYRGGFSPLEQLLESYIKMGFAHKRGDSYSFTPQGFLISNRLINELLDAQAERKSQVATPWRDDDYYDNLETLP
jgi:oxygen-independent coproporphyrinogen-3 oxidase